MRSEGRDGLIVLDASAVPDRESGARTRLRGLVEACARAGDLPPLVVRIARGSTLLDGDDPGAIRVEAVRAPGGPLRRALAPIGRGDPLARAARLWHSETIPPRGPPGAPALLTLHDLRWLEPRSVTGAPWSNWAARHLAARAWLPRLARSLAGVVTVSQASRRAVIARLRTSESRTFLVPNATALAAPSIARAGTAELGVERATGTRDERPFVLAVGHLERRKGLELVLEAIAGAAAGSPLSTLRLVLAGDGPDRIRLERRALELGVRDRVEVRGRVSPDGLDALFARAVALVFPSRLEGFGFPVYEALARGCPVIASDLDAFDGVGSPGLVLVPRQVARWRAELEEVARRAALPSARRPPFPVTPRISWDDAAATLRATWRECMAADPP